MAANFEAPDKHVGAFVVVNFEEMLPENHPARFIAGFIESYDLSIFSSKYKVGDGQVGRSPKDIRMMLGVILYALFTRIYSAHKISEAVATRTDFWYFTHNIRISHDKISDFINVHANDMLPLFARTISLARANDLLSFEALYEDGFFLKANASKEHNLNVEGLSKSQRRSLVMLSGALMRMSDPDSETTPEETVKIKQKARYQLERLERIKKQLKDRVELYSEKDYPCEAKEREQKATINYTDPDAELCKTKDGSFANVYTKVTGIDPKADIIVSSLVSGHNDESHMAMKVMKQANVNCEGQGKYQKLVADAGFNTKGTSVQFEAHGMVLIAPTKEHENISRNLDIYNQKTYFKYDEIRHSLICSEGRELQCEETTLDFRVGTVMARFEEQEACRGCIRLAQCTKSKIGIRKVRFDMRTPVQQRMLDAYKSDEGQQLYKKRAHVGETVQGDLKKNGNMLQLLRRGLNKVKVDSILQDIVWNLRRIYNSTEGNPIVEMIT